jgi:transcriptional regulator with XRE-family HTH domain
MGKILKQNKKIVPADRVREARKNLGLTLPALAELATQYVQNHGEPDREIIHQTVSRLEKGEIGMSLEWLTIIAGALNMAVGFEKYKPWHLIADPQELDNIVQSEEERRLLARRRELADEEQRAFDAMTENAAETLKNLKKSKN